MSASRRLLAVAGLLVTFVAGAFVGFAADRILLHRSLGHHPSPRMIEFLVERLDRRLDLTPQQRVEVKRIIEDRHRRIDAAWVGMRSNVHKEIEGGNADIERILTPEQRKKFDQIKMRLIPRRDGRGIRFHHE